MRLNRDNYEMVMFDLLEGNLSERDELRVMEQIEEDEFYFKEWKLFKSTLLVADEKVVFANKSSLLRKEAVAIPMYRHWMAVAASILLLAVAFVFWPREQGLPIASDTPTVIPSEENNNTVERDSAIYPQEEVVEEVIVRENLNEGVEAERSYKPVTEVYQERDEVIVKEQHDLPVSEKVEELDDKEQEDAIQRIAQEEVKRSSDVKNIEEVLTESSEDNPVIVANNNTRDIREEYSTKEKMRSFVTNNSRKRIKEKANEIIALVSNPKISFKPHFKDKRPSLEIALETNGYQAIASLQPFKNRNN